MANMSLSLESPDGYSCGICSQRFHHPSLIYCCNYGHFFCQSCYKHEYYEGKGPSCPHRHCKSPIYRMDKHIIRSSNDRRKDRKMFPSPDEIAKNGLSQSSSSRSLSSMLKGDGSSYFLSPSSKKPVNCPYPGCMKTIAVTAVDSHFKYEHKTVACITTPYETRNGLEFNPYDISCNQRMCIVLINVITDMDMKILSGNVPNLMAVSKPVMLVMASRVPYIKLENKEEEEQNTEDDDCSDEYDSYSNYYPFDKIIFWVAANIPTKCKYTLAISTPCKAIRLKYVGPVSQLNEECLKLCQDGKGLILNQPHILGMTSNGKKALSLDVILHKTDIDETQEPILKAIN